LRSLISAIRGNQIWRLPYRSGKVSSSRTVIPPYVSVFELEEREIAGLKSLLCRLARRLMWHSKMSTSILISVSVERQSRFVGPGDLSLGTSVSFGGSGSDPI
jgi:hypothetical protein